LSKVNSYVQPATLYRYRSLEKFDREISAIEDASLFLAPHSRLNDPMEGRFSVLERLRGGPKYESLIKKMGSAIEEIGICSFSETHDNEIMWAHYAQQFAGICVAYRFSKLLTNLNDSVEFIRLSYQDKAPTIPQSKTPEYLAKRVLSCKSYRWLYEREWRAFGPQGQVEYKVTSGVQTVYLGAEISSTDKKKIIAAMKPLGIRCRLMSLEKYSITFTDCK